MLCINLLIFKVKTTHKIHNTVWVNKVKSVLVKLYLARKVLNFKINYSFITYSSAVKGSVIIFGICDYLRELQN
jgi:hypothetical protein